MKSRKHTKTLPILLTGQSILLLGAGNVAVEKARVLYENKIDFSVISQEISPKMRQYCQDITLKRFKRKDIKKHLIVIDATGSQKVHDKLIKHKQKHPLLLNVVDVPALCDFYFMALTANAPLQIAVTSSGISPTLSKYFRDKAQALLPEGLDRYMQELADQRSQGYIHPQETEAGVEALLPQAYLIGCGLGDSELLTIKAYKTIRSVDIVLYDHLISPEIMALVPEETKKIYVGKQKGFHSKPQEEINALLVLLVAQGHRVARLKSGDPFIFGRGSEELAHLAKEGIATEVIPGISSAISASLLANIPLTARGIASSFSVVSAHLKRDAMDLDWINQLKHKSHTVVVLMGLSRATEIQNQALSMGVDPTKPCAIISNASRANQSVQHTTLQHLGNASKQAQQPAIILFGDVAHFPHSLKES